MELKERAARPTSNTIVVNAILVELKPAPVCQQRVWGTEEVEIEERSEGSRTFGTVAPYLGTLMIAGGGALFVAEVASDDISPVLVPISIATFVFGIGLAIIGKPLQRTMYRTRTETRPGRSYVTVAKCPDDLTFAWDETLTKSFRLDTPWGTTVQGEMVSGPRREPTVRFYPRLHETSIVYDVDLTQKLRRGWKLHLGGDRTFPLELTEREVSVLQSAAHYTLMHGLPPGQQRPPKAAPPPAAAAPRDPGCAPARALAKEVAAQILRHEGSCQDMATALEEVRKNHARAMQELQSWQESAGVDEDAPCGFPLESRADSAMTSCRGQLPAWTAIFINF